LSDADSKPAEPAPPHHGEVSSVQLLWSGGWDSTFRLLTLVIERRLTVQPHYIVDRTRQSLGNEMEAMESIRTGLERTFGGAVTRLLPTVFTEKDDIPPSAPVSEAMARLKLKTDGTIGSQYEWLTRYAHTQASTPLEVGVVSGDRMLAYLAGQLISEQDEAGDFYRIRDDPRDDDLLVLRPFRFPLLDVTKRGAGAIAERSGYAHLMELTWFCHRPRPDGSPCGLCTPCNAVRREGLSRRIPLGGHLRRLRQVAGPYIPRALWAGRHGLVQRALRSAVGHRSGAPVKRS
jgi:hypothetical protein